MYVFVLFKRRHFFQTVSVNFTNKRVLEMLLNAPLMYESATNFINAF